MLTQPQGECGLVSGRFTIAAYCYALLRQIEFACAWLASVRDSDFKILLGCKLGHDAGFLGQFQQRLREMLTESSVVAPSRAYTDNFDRAIRLGDEHEVAGFFLALTEDLIQDVNQYFCKYDRLADEPSMLLLGAWRVKLTEHAEVLGKWGPKPFPIASIATPDGGPGVAYSGTEPLPDLVAFPARSAVLKSADTSIFRDYDKPIGELVCDREFVRRFCHSIYLDIEIQAMEVCGRNIIGYRQMPVDFKLDMARQIWDEGRHAMMLKRRLESLGGREGDYTYDCRVWRRYFLGETLAERLALQQVIQEGNSVEGNMVFIAAFREVGDHETAEILEYINADETVHARFGNKWLLWLVDNSHAEYENTLNRVMANSGLKIPGKAPVNKYTRALSAFPMWFIEGLP